MKKTLILLVLAAPFAFPVNVAAVENSVPVCAPSCSPNPGEALLSAMEKGVAKLKKAKSVSEMMEIASAMEKEMAPLAEAAEKWAKKNPAAAKALKKRAQAVNFEKVMEEKMEELMKGKSEQEQLEMLGKMLEKSEE